MTEYVEQNPHAAARSSEPDPRAEGEARAATREEPIPADQSQGAEEPLEQQLERARSEASANHDRYLRAMADMDNFKKRMERTYADRAESSKKELLRKLLAVKDNLERAVHYGNSSESGEGVIEGVKLTQYQLDQLLVQEGVKPIEAAGKPFDPRLEEAVQRVHDASLPDETVVQVVRGGYTYGDSVLRPAQVVVSVHESG
ncbi:MAG TPA: nucleotide exchange factor GrpE [Chloroflexota bacterium]|nr:nucleotide exchange factor GrpE [Chloroflexota bacterium]